MGSILTSIQEFKSHNPNSVIQEDLENASDGQIRLGSAILLSEKSEMQEL